METQLVFPRYIKFGKKLTESHRFAISVFIQWVLSAKRVNWPKTPSNCSESLALLADMPTFAVTREIFTAIPVSSLYFISTSLTGAV